MKRARQPWDGPDAVFYWRPWSWWPFRVRLPGPVGRRLYLHALGRLARKVGRDVLTDDSLGWFACDEDLCAECKALATDHPDRYRWRNS